MNWTEITVSILAVLAPTAVGFWATIKWFRDVIDRIRTESAEREKSCVERLQKTEDSRHADAVGCIAKNTEAFVENTASNRELSQAVKFMAVATAGLPSIQDAGETRRKLQRLADEITPMNNQKL